MSTNEPERVSIEVNHLRYLHFAIDASVNGAWTDIETGLAIKDAQHTALEITRRIFGLGPGIGPVCAYVPAPFPAIPDLPSPGDTAGNPLLPEPAYDDRSEKQPVTAVVYAVAERFDSFFLLDERDGVARVTEIGAIQGCTTLGELRELVPTLTVVESPLAIAEDDYPYLPDSTEIDVSQDGCWPPMPTQYALGFLPREVRNGLAEHAGAEELDTILDGNYLHLPLDREADMLAVLARFGIAARRDDSLFVGLE